MTTIGDRGPYSAAPSALGYFYQVRLALLESLRRLCAGNEFMVSIETLDDVIFERSDNALDVLQTKHHIGRPANLTDASEDLWKTLRIWCEQVAAGAIPNGSTYFLVTTEAAGKGSAASYLRADDERSPKKAMERLNSTATSSTNTENLSGYMAYKALTVDDRLELLNRTYILDSSHRVDALDNQLQQFIYVAVDEDHVNAFLERLEGWWFRRVVVHLVEKNAWPIIREELASAMSDFREQFKRDNLPIDQDLMLQSIDASGYQDKVFVEQLRLIGLSDPRILIAINDYFRAFEQRSRWMREDLLLIGELGKYEATLVREWNIRFERMRQRLGESATDELLRENAQTLYEWIETGLHPSIRPRVTEPTIARGTYHILSDIPRVGWHAEFEERVRRVLEMRGA